MKIIFLDIDGVLATEYDSWIPPHEIYAYPFDPKCVKILNEILEITDAQIVLSSDWRLMYNNDLMVLDELFKFNGIIRSPIDVTPNLLRNRDLEISTYLKDNKEKIEQFVILDDADLKNNPANFVRCDIQFGIKAEGLKDRVIEIFGNCKY